MIKIKQLREYFKPNEKANLPVALIFSPTDEFKNLVANISVSFVIDVSGSMHELFRGRKKIEIVIDALSEIFRKGTFSTSDDVSLIAFDDQKYTLIPLRRYSEISGVEEILPQLSQYGGGTKMGLGMREGLNQLESSQGKTTKKMILFTDGETTDEEECLSLASECFKREVVVDSFGLGSTYNENLLLQIAQKTRGCVPIHLSDLSNFSSLFGETVLSATKMGITNVVMKVVPVKDVYLNSVNRVLPDIMAIEPTDGEYNLRNISVTEKTVFLLEFSIPPRPISKALISTIEVKYNVPQVNIYEKTFSDKIVVEFTEDPLLFGKIDPEVMEYVRGFNMSKAIEGAVESGDVKTLRVLYEKTQKLGNVALTKTLKLAVEELEKTGKLDPNTIKTIKFDSKTKTMKKM